MMKNKIHNLKNYSFSSGEQILVDANIWLYLHPAPTNPQQNCAKNYSVGFQRLMQAKAQPILDPLILSEYLNRYCRLEWDGKYKKNYSNFKDFRKSPDGKQVVFVASRFAREIVKLCDLHSTSVNEINMDHALDHFESRLLDFNDAILVDICKKRGFKLMTHDSDFRVGDIEVLTTNHHLLKL